MPYRTIDLDIPEGKPIPDLSVWVKRKYDKKMHNISFVEKDYSFISTTRKKHKILETIISMIDSAKKTIFLASFILENKEVEDALMRAVERLDGNVYVITVLETTVFKKMRDVEGDEIDENEAHKRFEELAKSGVYIRQHPSCHAKFLVVDKEEALLTSANIRDTSLKQNLEIGMRTKDSKTVDSLSSLFQHLWVHQTDRHYTPTNKPTLSSIPWRYRNKDVPAPLGDMTWTENKNHHLLRELIERINEAKETIHILTYNFRELDKGETKQLLDAMEEALKRGVDIDVVTHVSEKMLGKKTYESGLFSKLSKFDGHIELHGHPTVHAKYMVVDKKVTVLFTGNFDGRHGLTNGIDVGTTIINERVANEMIRWHGKIKNACPMNMTYEPDPIELSRGKATELIDISEIVLITKKDDVKNLLNRFKKLIGDNIAISSLDDSHILKEEFCISKINTVLKSTNNKRFEIKDLDSHANEITGYIKPGKLQIRFEYPLTRDEIDNWLQDYLFSLDVKKDNSVCTIKDIVRKFGKNYEPYELTFKNDIKGWKKYLKNILGKGIWDDFDLRSGTIIKTATEKDIREILTGIEPSVDDENSLEIIKEEQIEKVFESSGMTLPRKYESWKNVNNLLPGRGWKKKKGRYQRKLAKADR